MAELIQEMSAGLAKLVEAAQGVVVRVDGRRRLSATGIVWSEEGVIVTANHVLRRDNKLRVGLADGPMIDAELIGRDSSTDLAALRITSTGLETPNWGKPSDLQIGHIVLALGRPGKSVQATLGIISALGGTWRTPSGGQVENYLQTDVVMYPGFSGGPLLSVDGSVLGLNTSAIRGVSVALPTPTVKRVVESLLAHGRVRRGYLGVGLQPVQLPATLSEELGQETGLLVVSVEPDSPADEAGITLGDTILKLGDDAIRQMDDLLAALGHDQVGAESMLQLLRGGERVERSVKIGER